MNNLILVIIISALVAFIISIGFILIKSLMSPKKIGAIQHLLKEGKFAQAEKTAKSIITKNPNDYLARYWLGKVYLEENKPELAFMEYKSINKNAVFDGSIPEIEFRKQIAELYSKFNEPESALKEYLLLTEMEPKNGENYYNCGRLYELSNQAANAMGFYQKAAALDKGNAKIHTALGYLLFRSKQFTEAKKQIDTSIRLSPETYSNYYYLGKILKENQDFSGAVKAFEKAIRDQEFRQRALIERGSCYMMVDQTDNAMGEYMHAIDCSKDDSSQETLYARYFLAACYEKTHNIEKALEQWEKINQRNRKFRDVPQKLNEYRALQSNDGMKEYLTSSSPLFIELCKKVAMIGYNLTCQKVDATPYGCTMLATEEKKDSWMNVKKQVFLLDFFRDAKPIEESVIRRIAENIREQNYYKALTFSSSGFSHAAITFAENRPVVLIGKENLENFLAKAGI